MKVSTMGLLALAVAATGFIAWVLWPPAASEDTGSPGARTATDSGAGGVTVTATREETPGGLRFALSIDTHTVDLSGYDPTGRVWLEDGSGARLAPTAEGIEENTGHHVSAWATFPATSGPWVLVVEDLAGVPERRMTF